jgi:8-oxo-dGTP pyrophosphatase MutT (NUDIX family)
VTAGAVRAGRAGYRLALLLMRAWWVLRRPRSRGVRCVLRHGEAFVLVRHTYGDERWMLPGGRVHRGEDPLEAARREMRQELGVIGTGWRELGRSAAREPYRRGSAREPFRRHSTHFIEAEVASPALRPRPAELRDAAWFTLGSLPAGCSDALELALQAGWLGAGERAGAAAQTRRG